MQALKFTQHFGTVNFKVVKTLFRVVKVLIKGPKRLKGQNKKCLNSGFQKKKKDFDGQKCNKSQLNLR